MRLEFREKHTSIDQFEPIEIPDFVVLTGVNGSGKSHLLEAIENGRVAIIGVDLRRVVRFTYETFKLDNEQQFSAHQLMTDREAAWSHFNQRIKPQLQDARKQLGEIEDLKQKCLETDTPFLSLDDDRVRQYKDRIEILLNIRKGQPAEQHVVGIQRLARNLPYPLDEIEHDEFCELFRPSASKNGFLPKDIGKVFWSYYVKYRRNQVNEFHNEKYGKTYPVTSEEDFFAKHGKKPWDAINEVLASFQTLRYRISSPEGEDESGGFQARLVSIDEPDLEVSFDKLSSGEKVLMALVSAVYKAASDSQLPELLLLDEVDASLHPSMMKNMLSAIEEVFLRQGVKVILVTHSPTTVALAPDGSVFAMNKTGQNRIEKKTKQDALSILTDGFVTLDQGLKILGESSASKVTIITEGHNASLISKAIELYQVQGASVLRGIESVTGDTQLKALFDFFARVRHEGRVLFVWDCDVKYRLVDTNSVYPFVLPKNLDNNFAVRGIENMFPEALFDGFLTEVKEPGKPIIKHFASAKKKEFCDYILKRNAKEDFVFFESLMQEIRRIDALPR